MVITNSLTGTNVQEVADVRVNTSITIEGGPGAFSFPNDGAAPLGTLADVLMP